MQRPGVDLVPRRGARHVLRVKGEGRSLPGAALNSARLELLSAQRNQPRLFWPFILYTLPAAIRLWHALYEQCRLLPRTWTHLMDATLMQLLPGRCVMPSLS